MRIKYDAQDDILHIEFSRAPVVKDVSHGWNVNLSFAQDGLAGITILNAKAAGYWPLENTSESLPLTTRSDEQN